VRISDFAGIGIKLDTASISYGTLNTIDNVQIDGCAHNGIVLQGANVKGGTTVGTRIVHSNVVCDASKGEAVTIRIDAAAATYIAGNYLEGKGNGGIGVWIKTQVNERQVLQTRDTVLLGNRMEALDVGVRVDPGQIHPIAGYVGNHTEVVTTERQGF